MNKLDTFLLWILKDNKGHKKGDLWSTYILSQWQKALHWAHKSSACANHREQYQKLLTRWYYTPHRISKAYPTAFPYCWRSCGGVGSLLHVFWSCPSLKSFWDNILTLISTIAHKSCPRGPEFALLLIGIESIPLIHRRMICNILHAARLGIARHWKSADIPTLVDINAIVSNVCIHKRTLAWHRGYQSKCQKYWSSWLTMFPNLPC